MPIRARRLVLEMSETEFNQWRHHPVTAEYLRFLADQADNFRAAAADLWELGRLSDSNPDPNVNSSVLRGRMMTLRELHGLKLSDMQDFYRQEEDDEGTTA